MLNSKKINNSILQFIDIFGLNISIPLNNKWNLKTNVGGLLSIFFILFLILFLIINLKSKLIFNNYEISRIKKFDPKKTIESNFQIAISLSNSNGTFIPDIYNYLKVNISYINNSIPNYHPINNNCSKFSYFNNFSFLNCFDFQNLKLGNKYRDYYYNNYININISLCNSNITNNCLINNVSINQNYNLHVYYLDYNIDQDFKLNNSNTITSNDIVEDIFIIDLNLSKILRYYAMETFFSIENGPFKTDSNGETTIQSLESKNVDYVNGNNIFSILIYASKHYDKIFITFMPSYLTFLSKLGGFLYFSILVVKIILSLSIGYSYQEEITLKRIFNSDLTRVLEEEIDLNGNKLNLTNKLKVTTNHNQNLINNNGNGNQRDQMLLVLRNNIYNNINQNSQLQNNFSIRKNPSSNNSLNNNIDHSNIDNNYDLNSSKKNFNNNSSCLGKSLISHFNPLDQKFLKKEVWFSFKDKIKICLCSFSCCCLNKELKHKAKIYEVIKDKTKNLFDLNHIYQTVFAFERLKSILFNPKQNNLFNFLSSKNIYLFNQLYTDYFEEDYKSINNTCIFYDELRRVYSNGIENLGLIDRRLYELVDYSKSS